MLCPHSVQQRAASSRGAVGMVRRLWVRRHRHGSCTNPTRYGAVTRRGDVLRRPKARSGRGQTTAGRRPAGHLDRRGWRRQDPTRPARRAGAAARVHRRRPLDRTHPGHRRFAAGLHDRGRDRAGGPGSPRAARRARRAGPRPGAAAGPRQLRAPARRVRRDGRHHTARIGRTAGAVHQPPAARHRGRARVDRTVDAGAGARRTARGRGGRPLPGAGPLPGTGRRRLARLRGHRR